MSLEFGTAGIRGPMGPGPDQMNGDTVARVTAALAAYLHQQQPNPGAVVIGYDCRHHSSEFAHVAAEVLCGSGLSTMILPRALPTPVLAFATGKLGCSAGIMITASHNPATDNGFKVYVQQGLPLAPPDDARIAALIPNGPASGIPRGDDWTTLDEAIVRDYISAVAELTHDDSKRHLRVAYTPMHGVGGEVFCRVLEAAALPEPFIVAEQFSPDPDFPTVAFPNPEEPGAMDLLISLANTTDADVAIANDPDADRCAAAFRDGSRMRILSGDEFGVLLAWWMLHRGEVNAFASSIASGSLMRAMVEDRGVEFRQTLTGFKWIARQAGSFGYEEALGYEVAPKIVKDKDGISAALMFIEMAAALKANDLGVNDVLDEIEGAYGVHLTGHISIRDIADMPALMARLREAPPHSIGGQNLIKLHDLSRGTEGLPPTNALIWHLGQSDRVLIRPSGTEPKVKCYLEVVEPVGIDGLTAARAIAKQRLDAMSAGILALLS